VRRGDFFPFCANCVHIHTHPQQIFFAFLLDIVVDIKIPHTFPSSCILRQMTGKDSESRTSKDEEETCTSDDGDDFDLLSKSMGLNRPRPSRTSKATIEVLASGRVGNFSGTFAFDDHKPKQHAARKQKTAYRSEDQYGDDFCCAEKEQEDPRFGFLSSPSSSSGKTAAPKRHYAKRRKIVGGFDYTTQIKASRQPLSSETLIRIAGGEEGASVRLEKRGRKPGKDTKNHDAHTFADKLRAQMLEELQDPRKRQNRLLNYGLMIEGRGTSVVLNPDVVVIDHGSVAVSPPPPPLAAKEIPVAETNMPPPSFVPSPTIADKEEERAVVVKYEKQQSSLPDDSGKLDVGETATRQLVVRKMIDETEANMIMADMFLCPEQKPEAQVMGEHRCDWNCEYQLAIDCCGYNGCETMASMVMEAADRIMPREERAALSPEDIWLCTVGGNLHICTQDRCDSKEYDEQGAIVCARTKRVFGRMIVPSFDSDFGAAATGDRSGMGRIGGDAYRSKMQNYAWSAMEATPYRPPSADIPASLNTLEFRIQQSAMAMAAATKQTASVGGIHQQQRQSHSRYATKRQKKGLSSSFRNREGVVGTAASVVSGALRSALRKFSAEDPNDQLLLMMDPSENAVSRMTAAKARARTAALRAAFRFDPRWETAQEEEEDRAAGAIPPKKKLGIVGNVAEERLKSTAAAARRARLEDAMASSYIRAIQLAAVVIVSLPMAKKSLPLTGDRASEYIETYGELVWRGWTLAIASPTRCSIETETKFRQFALGILYQAKCGYEVPFDVATVAEYAENSEPINAAIDNAYFATHRHAIATRQRETAATKEEDAALSAESSSISPSDRRKWFAKKYAITFLKLDTYLGTRLVQENHVGQKGTVVDGVQTESVGVNGGISLVEEALSEIAEWSKRRFVLDILAGIDGKEAIARIVERSRVMKIS